VGALPDDSIAIQKISNNSALDASKTITFGAGANGLTFTNDGSGNFLVNLTSTGDFVIQDNGSAALQVLDTGAISIGSSTSNGAVTIDAGTGTLSIGNGASAKTINIGTGSTGDSINIGTGSTSTAIFFAKNTAAPSWSGTEGLVRVGYGTIGNNGTSGRMWVRANNINFRFNSASNVGDYSEFIAQSEPSSPGDIMVIDSANTQMVRKSHSPYEENILGAISVHGTSYNNGDCWDEVSCDRTNDPNYANIGMLGQVDVKVTTQNGPIAIGDRITTSSLAGVGMKATKAGQVVGRALSAYTDGDSSHIGMIHMLVSPTYFDPGTPDTQTVQDFVINAGSTQAYSTQIPWATSGKANEASNFGAYSIQAVAGGVIKALGTFTTAIIGNIKSGAIDTNELTSDRLLSNTAAVEHLTAGTATIGTINGDPTGTLVVNLGQNGQLAIHSEDGQSLFTLTASGSAVFAGSITAQSVKANTIEGLTVINHSIDDLSAAYSTLASASAVLSSVLSASDSGLTVSGPFAARGAALFTNAATFMNDVLVKGNTTIYGLVSVMGQAIFQSPVSFAADVLFSGHMTVNRDTAGAAIIPASSSSVDVIFDVPYKSTPIVTLSLNLSEATDSAFMAEAIHAAVAHVTTKGFTIVLESPVPKDLTYSWFAIAVDQMKTTVGKSIYGTVVTGPTPTGVPMTLGAESGPVTPSATVAPSATPVPTAAPTPTAGLTPSPTQTPTPDTLPTPTPTL
jgi:hypothetical protein